jgi:hypothetical protein
MLALKSRKWEREYGYALRGLIAADIEALRRRGIGLYVDTPIYTGWRHMPRKLHLQKYRPRRTAHLTHLFYAAITDPIIDLYRTDKTPVHSGTTARIALPL